MTRKQHEAQTTSDNMRSSVNSEAGAKEVREDQTATSLKRAVARRGGRAPNRLNLLAGLSADDLQRLRTRFDAKWTPEPNTGCYLWTAALNNGGYGIFGFRARGTPVRSVGAHRLSYEMTHGPIAEGLDIDHKCRQRSCVNPAHLEAVSHRENMRRGGGFAGQNALKTHCKRGHEFTSENTRKHGRGNRSCKRCERLRSLGLHHPALTPMPEELRSLAAQAVSGRRVAGGSRAVTKSPYALRAERKGHLVGLVEFLKQVRTDARTGVALTEAVADGTLWGWRARMALSDCLGVALATWDCEAGRTKGERLALVERALAECGEEPHRGGWTVGR